MLIARLPVVRPLVARLLLALVLVANGLAMLFLPGAWFQAVPGVIDSGPLNPHFVRDIGCAYLVAAGGFVWVAWDARAWPAALAGSAFLTAHALLHLIEAGAGLSHTRYAELPGVFLLPALALWLSWPHQHDIAKKEHAHAELDRPPPTRRV
jgi:uncharacterized protein YjeT (DUF2065 family)